MNNKKSFPHADWFNKDLLEEINIRITKDDGKYGEAESINPNGYRTFAFNKEGISVSYEGNKLEPNIFVEIKLDGGTRKVFHGIVYNKTDLIKVLELIR